LGSVKPFSVGFFWFGRLHGRIFPWKKFSLRKRLSVKGAQDFLALFRKKNNEKINMKSFFLLKVRSSFEN